MIKVSIIVPVYNVEKYLRRCLDSLINQTLRDIEIITIDDGSTDSCLSILREYEKLDSRIKILTQENAKQGAARNRGLEIATGEFITFVDSDDWLELDYCELLYNAAQKYNVNIAASSTTRDYKHKVKNHLKLKEEKVYYGVNEIIQALEYNYITGSKLYRFEPIKNLRFEENVFYEDGVYTLKAFDMEKSLVTVPDARYHYYSNPTSTMKHKLDVKKENDRISTSLQLIRYAKEHDIKINKRSTLVYKEDHFWWAIKHYYDKKEFYLCGIKIFTKKEPFDNVKKIVVFNTACFGDVLLCNSLVQNIKNIFPESRVIFVCDKNWEDIAKYQEGVDEVIVYDKKGTNKGFGGMLKFIRNFKYKKPYASFITYRNERNYLIAKLLGSRFVLMPKKEEKELYIPLRETNLLQKLTNKKVQNLPIKYNLPNTIKNPLEGEKYVVLCCITKNPPKDMPIDTAIGLIRKINSETDCKVVLTGAGELCSQYAKELESSGVNFINLVNKTSLLELGAVLKGSIGLISCDTGTMHFGCANNVPTIAVFYEDFCVPIWAPKTELYRIAIIDKEQNSENIFKHLEMLNGK